MFFVYLLWERIFRINIKCLSAIGGMPRLEVGAGADSRGTLAVTGTGTFLTGT